MNTSYRARFWRHFDTLPRWQRALLGFLLLLVFVLVAPVLAIAVIGWELVAVLWTIFRGIFDPNSEGGSSWE
jgi:hypothetical protein